MGTDREILMKKLPKQYKYVTIYDVIDRVTITYLLDRKLYYEACYYVENEADDPLPIRDSTAYLRNQRGNKKVYILKLMDVYSEFTE